MQGCRLAVQVGGKKPDGMLEKAWGAFATGGKVRNWPGGRMTIGYRYVNT